MADKTIHQNPTTLNRNLQKQSKTLKLQSEMYKREFEGIISEYAKEDGKNLGISPAEAKKLMGLFKSDVLQDFENTIAVLDHQRVRNVMASGSLNIYQGGGIKRPPKYPQNPEQLMFYDELHSKALSTLTEKKSSGQELMWKTEKINDELTYSFNHKANTFSNFADVQESFRYFKSGEYGLSIFDLETFGGKNEYGKQEVDMITEFTFDHYKDTMSGTKPERVSGFVGMNGEQAARLAKEFEDFTDFNLLTEKQQVTAKSLVKIGNKDTLIEEDKTTPGRFLVKKYGEQEEITKESVLRGIQKSKEIGERQSQFLHDGMKVWEKDLADSILKIQNGDMSVSGYNITRYDLPVLNQYLANDASGPVIDYMKEKGFNGHINIPQERNLDMLSAIQMADVNPKTRQTIWKDDKVESILKKDNHSMYQQEALVKNFLSDLIDNTEVGAHSSDFDTEAYHKLLTEVEVNDKLLIDQVFEFAEEEFKDQKSVNLKQDKKQLFYATKSMGGDFQKESLFGFKIDDLTGSLKTMDGVELSESLDPARAFPEYLTKKDVSYTIDTIEKISANKEYVEGMKKVNPALAVNELYAVKMSPVIDEEIAGKYAKSMQKNYSPSVIIGPIEDVKSAISNNFILYGEQDKSGEYQLAEGVEEFLSKHKLKPQDGKAILEKVDSENLVKETIRDGTFVNINDSAARTVRENKMTRYEGLSRFSKELGRLAEEDISDLTFEEKKNKALEKILEVSRDIAKDTSEGKTHSLSSQSEAVTTFQDLIGYKNFNTGERVVNPKTIDNAIASLDHFNSIEEEINLLLEEVNKRTSGSSKAEKNYMFSKGLEAIQAKAMEKMETENLDMLDGFVRGYQMDYFEIDMSPLDKKGKGSPLAKTIENTNPDGVMKINLKPGGEHKLVKDLLGDIKGVNREPEAIKRLDAFVKNVQDEEGLLMDFYGDKNSFLKKNNSTTFARKVIEGLIEERENDPTLGFLNTNQIHNVIGSSEMSGALNEEDIIKTIDEVFQDFKVGSISPVSTNDDQRRTQASKIVREILMDPFNEESLKEFGYNEEQIRKLGISRKVREKEYIDYVDEMLQGISKTNMEVWADSKTGIFGLVDGDEFIDLNNVPREKYSDGIFYTQIGRSKVATELHLNTGRGASSVRLTSAISEAVNKSNWNLPKSIDRAVRRGEDPNTRVTQWISKIADSVREGSAISMLDEQDLKSQFEVYEKGIINALPQMQGLEDLDLHFKNEFIEKVQSGRFSHDKIDDTGKQLWSRNREIILNKIASETSDPDVEYVLNRIIASKGKHSAVESGRVRYDSVQMELESHGNTSRDVDNQARFLAFREDYAKDVLKRQGMDRQIEIGSPLRTELGHSASSRAYRGINEGTQSEFVATRRALTGSMFQEEVAKLINNTNIDEEIRALEAISLTGQMTEGGAIADARIADAIFDNYGRQRVSFNRVLLLDHDDNIKTIQSVGEMSKVIPKINVSENGEIEFAYKKGRFVEKGEKLFDEYLEYGDTYKPVGSKDEGALRFGFFTKGQEILANEEEVARNVKELADKKGLKIASQTEFIDLAEDIYDVSFYVERLSAEPYRKVMEGSVEKHMTHFAYHGLGDSGNKNIVKVIDQLGLEDHKGKILSKQFFDELLDVENISNSILADMSKLDNLDEDTFMEIIKNSEFKDVESFKKALAEERYRPSVMLKKALGEKSLVGGVDVALINEEMGHKNRMNPVRSAINNLVKIEADTLDHLPAEEAIIEARKKVVDDLDGVFMKDGKSGLAINDQGKIVVPNTNLFSRGDYIDVNRLEDVYDKRLGEGSFNKIMHSGENVRQSFALMQDFTGITGSGIVDRAHVIQNADGTVRQSALTDEQKIVLEQSKGAKITDREIEMLHSSRYDQSLINKVSKELSPEEFESVFGHMVDNVEGNHLLREEYSNKAILEDFTDEVRRSQFLKSGEAIITPETAPIELKDTVRSMQRISGGDVGLQTAEKMYSIDMNMKAMMFNNRGDSHHLSEMIKDLFGESVDATTYNIENLQTDHGFKIMSLSEIDIAKQKDADYLLKDSLSGIYNNNLIIDLQDDDIITEEMIKRTNHGSRYIALGKLPAGKLGDELIQQEPHNVISSLLNAREKLSDPQGWTKREIDIVQQGFINDVDNFNQSISKVVTSKKGMLRDVSEVRLEKSVRGKASLLNVDDIIDHPKLTGIIDSVLIGDKTISDHYKDNTIIDFKVMSEAQFEKMGLFDKAYMDDLGVDKEGMKSILREGVDGYSHRHPTVYQGSLRPTTLILSDDLKGTMAIESAAGAISGKADSDGDAPASWIARYTDEGGREVDSVQYKVAQRNNEVLSPAIEEKFQNQKASMYVNALTTNRYFANKVNKDASDLALNIDSKELTSMYSTSPSGRVYPSLDRMPTKVEEMSLYDKYQEVNRIAVDQKLLNTPELSTLDPDVARLEIRTALDEDMDENVKYLKKAISTLPSEVQEDYAFATDYHLESIRDKAAAMSKYKRSSAGEINIPMYQVNRLRNLSYDALEGDEHRFLSYVLEAAEESFLSPKHSDAMIVDNALTMSEFNKAMRSVAGNPIRGESAGTSLLENWFETNLPGRFRYDMFEDLNQEDVHKKAANLFQRVFSNQESVQKYDSALKQIGSFSGGVSVNKIDEILMFPEESRSLMSQSLRVLNETGNEFSPVSSQKKRVYEDTISQEFLNTKWRPPTDENLRTSSKNVLEGIQSKISKLNVSGKDLAFGALGIAGAVMVAGFVGGNPSQPAMTQASDQPEGMYSIPSMSDQDLSVQQGSGGGYVININANSNRGRRHVEEAIQQAMAQSYNSTNINVSMNIKDSTGNITDRNIEEMIRGSFN